MTEQQQQDQEEFDEAEADMRSEVFFESMAKDYPELMEKSIINYFGVQSGWYTIIALLCHGLYAPISQAQRNLSSAKFLGNTDKIDKLTQALADAIEDLPVISDVKEKFGTMRFHVYAGTPEAHALIDFAEGLSAHTCEKCGDRGETDTNGWIKTHCKKHFRKTFNPQDAK